jgi:hypothetical protein
LNPPQAVYLCSYGVDERKQKEQQRATQKHFIGVLRAKSICNFWTRVLVATGQAVANFKK